MAIKRKYLGELLIDMGMITSQQLEECLKEQKTSGERLGKILRGKGYVTEQQLMEIMEFQLGIPLVNLETVAFSHSLAKYMPVALAKKHKMVPVRVDSGKLYVAMNDPLDFIALDDARMVSGLEVLPLISPEHAIETGINKVYGNEYAESAIKDLTEEHAAEDAGNGEDSAAVSDAPIVRLVSSIFEQAAKARASDIHVEPGENDVRVRMRIDGQLITLLTIPKRAQSAVITRLKIIGNMDIAEKARAAGRPLQAHPRQQRNRRAYVEPAHRARRKDRHASPR